MTVVLGIDPGWTGAVAMIERADGRRTVRVWKMPEDDLGIVALAKKLKTFEPAACVLELVNVRPKQGISSAWKFAANYFAWKTSLLFLGIRHDLVVPQSWQKEFDLIVPGISKLPQIERERLRRAKKNRHKEAAAGYFKSLKVTLANCDALLLALYAERKAARIPACRESRTW